MLKQSHAASRKHAASTIWVVDAPWAHPLWSQYVVVLMDLTTELGGDPPLLYLEGATHEVQVWAADPTRDPITELRNGLEGVHLLEPPNHVYQFIAESDAAAETRIEALVLAIEARTLNPDTDYRSAWDRLFADGKSLRMRKI